MAWLVKKPSGAWAVQFKRGEKRKTIALGRIDKVDGAPVRRHIEHLLRAIDTAGMMPLPPATIAWLPTIRGTDLEAQLIRHGLVQAPKPVEMPEQMTLGRWIEEYIHQRVDVKDATKITFGNIRRNLIGCFAPDKPLAEFTPGDGDRFKSFLVGTEKLADNTVRRRIGLARQVFAAAQRRKLVSENPFGHITANVKGNPAKFRFVSMDDYHALIKAAPDAQWRAIIALCRIGGVRCPSEVLPLRWADVDWDKGRLRVTSPKTEHHEGGAERILPLFSELATALAAAYDPNDPSEFIITRYRDVSQNMRTTFTKIIRRAGLTPWPKLFVNLRASRATELVTEFPQHVCSAWLGHSADVAAEFYTRVRDEDYARALSPSLSASLSSGRANGATKATRGALSRHGVSGDRPCDAKNADSALDDANAAVVAQGGMGVAGLEPATSSV